LKSMGSDQTAVAFSSQGFSIYAGEWAAPNLLENIGLGIEKWTRKERLSRYQIGRSLVDENAVWRLVSELERIFE